MRDGSTSVSGEFISKDNLGGRTWRVFIESTRVDARGALRERFDGVTLADVIGLAKVSTLEIERGDWRVIGNHRSSQRSYLGTLPDADATMYTGEIPEEFLEAYHSLRSWNDFPMAPKWFRAILLPHLQPPSQHGVPAPMGSPTAESAPVAKAATHPAPAGPAQVHVTITYEGNGLPDVALLRKRQSVEAWIEAEGLGEVTDAGGGGGVMDVFVDAANARRTVAALKVKLDEVGRGTRSKIEVEPLEDAS